MMNHVEIETALRAAADAQRSGDRDRAARLYRELLTRAGEQPVALNALGMHALANGAFAEASALFRRAIVVDPQAIDLWMNLATSHRRQADLAGEKAALEGALSIDRRHFMAAVRMAELFERSGEHARASERWVGVLAMAPLVGERTPALEAMFEHARDFVSRQQAEFGRTVDTAMATFRSKHPAAQRRRIDACIDHTLGRRQIYPNICAGLHVPFLPADEFFDRDHFPWLGQIEQATDVIRSELMAARDTAASEFEPYVAMEPGTPTNKWSRLDHRQDWSALHLWKNGERNATACSRFPRTATLVEGLPLARIPGRAPTVFFSLLQPGTHLPAHTGVSNMRAIIHLPLVVPDDCGFRVGGETRNWQVGQAWAFDDTIEHEAWNRSSQVRAILILDVWNPYLTDVERQMLCAFFPIADRSGHVVPIADAG